MSKVRSTDPVVALVGNPNVGKSVIFNALTGARVTVSNYPGTTVGVSRGAARIDGSPISVVDTPGMYSLLPITEEEKVARSLLLDDRPALVVHVIEAKNLERMLVLTIQLIEAELDVLIALNMMDEAEASGIQIDFRLLEKRLGVPVVPMVALASKGIDELKEAIRAGIGEKHVVA